MIPALLLVPRNRALVGGAALALAAAAGGAWLAHRLDAPARAHAEARAVAAEAAAHAAQAQVRLDAEAAAAVETARAVETTAHRRTGAAADALARLPHAQDAVDPAVLAEWARAVDGMRDEAARAPADAPGGGDAARAVPTP